jgi:hypothetical protein
MSVEHVELPTQPAKGPADPSYEAEGKESPPTGRLDPAMYVETAILLVIDGISRHRLGDDMHQMAVPH